MTGAETLMWLNDRLGEPFAAEVAVAVGDFDWAVMTANGELKHHETAAEEGLYTIGGANIDLTQLLDSDVEADGRARELVVVLGDQVGLVFVHAEE